MSRISKSNGHGEREQCDRKSLQHSVFLPRYPFTDALVRLTNATAHRRFHAASNITDEMREEHTRRVLGE
jgi:hypothetical protein